MYIGNFHSFLALLSLFVNESLELSCSYGPAASYNVKSCSNATFCIRFNGKIQALSTSHISSGPRYGCDDGTQICQKLNLPTPHSECTEVNRNDDVKLWTGLPLADSTATETVRVKGGICCCKSGSNCNQDWVEHSWTLLALPLFALVLALSLCFLVRKYR